MSASAQAWAAVIDSTVTVPSEGLTGVYWKPEAKRFVSIVLPKASEVGGVAPRWLSKGKSPPSLYGGTYATASEACHASDK